MGKPMMNDKIKENLKTIQCFAEIALDNHKRSGEKFTGVNYGRHQQSC